MNYELAKELKEAGFVSKTPYPYKPCDKCKDYVNRSCSGCVRIPTLSELIEACGDRYICLEKHYGNNPFNYGEPKNVTWYEATQDKEDGWVSGKTPEEAVARLWLELNK